MVTLKMRKFKMVANFPFWNLFSSDFLDIYHRKLFKGTFLMFKDMASSNLTLILDLRSRSHAKVKLDYKNSPGARLFVHV